MGLDEYNRKRNFAITSEPAGGAPARARGDGARRFVIQKHAATRLHYDFRLELDGVLKSWSVPKGPSLDPKVKRLAMHVEDHPIAYAEFEGIIPKGQYGGGTVLLWDRGTWRPQGDPRRDYAAGNLKIVLNGEKLRGGFALIKLRGRGPRRGDDERSWLLIKERDGEARAADAGGDITALRPDSVATGRLIDDIARDRAHVWHSRTAPLDLADVPGAREAALPARIRPPRPGARAAPPAGEGWLHEIAIDGERLLARRDGDDVRLLSAAGAPLAAAAGRARARVADAVRMLPAHALVVDGVLTAVAPDGRAAPGGLPRALAGQPDATLAYFVFDLPYLDGHDLSATPLDRRKALLAALVARSAEPGPLRVLDHVAGGGAAFRRAAADLGIAAMVSRPSGSRYGARAGWVRTRTRPAGRGRIG